MTAHHPLDAQGWMKTVVKGQGTSGTVYACTKTNGQCYAVKVIDVSNDIHGQTEREIQALTLLANHNNVVKIFSFNFSYPQVFIVMECLETTLSHQIKTNTKGMNAMEALKETSQILQGLAYMHEQNVVHADIKPANLMHDAKGVLKITDMSLAQPCIFEKNGENFCKMPPHSSMVTLWYRCPSLILGATTFDGTIDVWATGAVLFELLYGRPAFAGRCEIATLFYQYKRLGTPGPDSSLAELKYYSHQHPKFPLPSTPLNEEDLEKRMYPIGLELLLSLLVLEPSRRPPAIVAADTCQRAVMEEESEKCQRTVTERPT